MKRIGLAVCSVFLAGSFAGGTANAQEVCRTPGFWGTHAGQEKAGSTNITEEVIRAWLSASKFSDETATDKCVFDNVLGEVHCNFEPPGQAGSPKACQEAKKNDVTLLNGFPGSFEGIEICGQIVGVAPVSSPNLPPVVEALCVSPGGDTMVQLGRQLTAAALNCVLSGGSSDCTGTSIESVFLSCNAACADSAQEGQTDLCIEKLDCFNNGGVWNDSDPAAAYCQLDVAESCHAQPLIGTVIAEEIPQ